MLPSTFLLPFVSANLLPLLPLLSFSPFSFSTLPFSLFSADFFVKVDIFYHPSSCHVSSRLPTSLPAPARPSSLLFVACHFNPSGSPCLGTIFRRRAVHTSEILIGLWQRKLEPHQLDEILFHEWPGDVKVTKPAGWKTHHPHDNRTDAVSRG